jgi:hypothetical protein
MEKRSQKIDINKNNTSRADVEQSQEDRKKILDVEEKNLTEEDDKNAADIGEEGNLILQIIIYFLSYVRFLEIFRIIINCFLFAGQEKLMDPSFISSLFGAIFQLDFSKLIYLDFKLVQIGLSLFHLVQTGLNLSILQV